MITLGSFNRRARTIYSRWPRPFRRPAWEVEGGADVATRLLQHFNGEHGTWDLPRTGHYWSAVSAAWDLGRRGEGQTIAIIDDGFDVSYPSLARQQMPWGSEIKATSSHGTVVALLIGTIAPKAEMILYPVASEKGIDARLIEEALKHASTTNCTIVNISLGKAHPVPEVYDLEGWMAKIQPWPELREDDVPFMVGEAQAQLDGWRELIKLAQTSIGRVAADLANEGRTIIAAAGNNSGFVFEPALFPEVYSAAFHQGSARAPKNMFDRVRYVPPSFTQSEFADFGVLQPPGVLGSSFAAPLIAGLAALMHDRTELKQYREVLWLSGNAAELMAQFVENNPNIMLEGIDRWIHVIDDVSTRAINAIPHKHSDGSATTCPECSFFALGVCVNYGIFKVNTGILDSAQEVLSRALSFAPNEPNATLVLGRMYAIKADWQSSNRYTLLTESARLLRKGLADRPDFQRDQELLGEVEKGLSNPKAWRLPKTFIGGAGHVELPPWLNLK